MQKNDNKTSQKIVESLIDVLKRKKLNYYFPEVSESIYKLNKKLQKEKTLIIWSVIPLASDVMLKIKKIMDLPDDKEIRVVNKINPALLAGFRAQYKDRVLDATIMHDLEALEKQLS